MESDFGGFSRPRASSRLSAVAGVVGGGGGASSGLDAAQPPDYSPLAMPAFKNAGAGSGGSSHPTVTASTFTPRSSVSAFSGPASITGSATGTSSQHQRTMTKGSQTTPPQTSALLNPPSGFCIIEPGMVYRAVIPLGSSNLAFLEPFNISVVLVLDEVPLSGKLAAYCQQMKIQVHLLPFKITTPDDIIGEFDIYMKKILNSMLSVAASKPVLVVGNSSNCYDVVVIGCLRRLQGWSFTSYIGEMRLLAQRNNYDLEQFVESCDLKSLESLASRLFSYRTVEDDIRTVILGKSIEDDRGSAELERRKRLYEKLFLCPSPTVRLTAGLEFDPNLSLVTGEAEDDD